MKTLGRTRSRILGIVLREASRNRCPTFQEIANECGVFINAVACHLRALRRDGLVTWELGHCGTLRPLVRFEPVSQ